MPLRRIAMRAEAVALSIYTPVVDASHRRAIEEVEERLFSGIPQDAIPEPAGVLAVGGDPDFLASAGMNEQHVAAFTPQVSALSAVVLLLSAGVSSAARSEPSSDRG